MTNLPLNSWATQASFSDHPSNEIAILMDTSQVTSPNRHFPNTPPPALDSNTATGFLSWPHTDQAAQSTPYPTLTPMTLTYPNTRPTTTPSPVPLTGWPYWPALMSLLSFPSSPPNKAHRITVTTKRPCIPSYTLSAPPPLVLHIIPMHQNSSNPLSTSPLTMTWRPNHMPPLPNLTNSTNLPCTKILARESKSETLSLMSRDSCSINSALCPATSSLDAEALSHHDS